MHIVWIKVGNITLSEVEFDFAFDNISTIWSHAAHWFFVSHLILWEKTLIYLYVMATILVVKYLYVHYAVEDIAQYYKTCGASVPMLNW